MIVHAGRKKKIKACMCRVTNRNLYAASRGQFYSGEADLGDREGREGVQIRTGGVSGVSEGYGATRVQWV